MPLKEITDKNGRCFTWWEYGGHFGPANARTVYFPQDPETQLKDLRTFEIRDNDVLICTFPKAGRHSNYSNCTLV